VPVKIASSNRNPTVFSRFQLRGRRVEKGRPPFMIIRRRLLGCEQNGLIDPRCFPA